MAYKPEWYEVVWELGAEDSEHTQLFQPIQRPNAAALYAQKQLEVSTVPCSNVRMYLTHTNKPYDLLHSMYHMADGSTMEDGYDSKRSI